MFGGPLGAPQCMSFDRICAKLRDVAGNRHISYVSQPAVDSFIVSRSTK